MKAASRTITLTPGPPHELDWKIAELARELRRLVNLRRMDRGSCFKPGHKHSAEALAKIAAASKGRRHNEATRAKMSASQRARAGANGRG